MGLRSLEVFNNFQTDLQHKQSGLELGFGDAGPAVRGEAATSPGILGASPIGVASTIAIAQSGSGWQIKVSIDITHTYIGDLRIEFISPGGRRKVVSGQLGDGQDNLLVACYDSVTPLSPLAAMLGEPMRCDWFLRAADLVSVDTGTLSERSLELVPS